MTDYIKNAFKVYESIEDIEVAFSSDIRSCETFGDFITAFNFWFGFVSGWCQNHDITSARQYQCYTHLKDELRNHLFFIFELELNDEYLGKEMFL